MLFSFFSPKIKQVKNMPHDRCIVGCCNNNKKYPDFELVALQSKKSYVVCDIF